MGSSIRIIHEINKKDRVKSASVVRLKHQLQRECEEEKPVYDPIQGKMVAYNSRKNLMETLTDNVDVEVQDVEALKKE